MANIYSLDKVFSETKFIENNKLSISQKDSLSPLVYTGSPIEEEYQQFTKFRFVSMQKYIDLSLEVSRIRDSTLREKRYKEEVAPSYKEYIALIKNYIAEHPASFVSLYQLFDVRPTVTMGEFKVIFYSLNKTIQNTPLSANFIKEIKKYDLFFNKEATNFTQKNDKGENVSLTSFKGKYVLVDFWASWCGPCRAENPNLIKEYGKYKEKGFEVLGVSLDVNEKLWKAAIESDKLPWMQVSELNGWKNTAAVQYYITGVPANFLVDPNGIIIAMDLRGRDLQKKLEDIFN